MTRNPLTLCTLAFVATILLLAGFALGVAPQPAYAASFVVDTTSDADLTACTAAPGDCSLRGAINNANGLAGTDTITFDIPSTEPSCTSANVCTISLGSTLPAIIAGIDGVTIDGSANGGTIVLDGNGYHILDVNTGTATTFIGFTIRGGTTASASAVDGAIQNSGALYLSDMTISDNLATGVGNTGLLDITNSRFLNNFSQLGDSGGAAISNRGTLRINQTTFEANVSHGANGGAIRHTLGSLSINDSTFSNNYVTEAFGGVIYSEAPGTITNSAFNGNYATSGGAIINNGGDLNVINSTFYDNRAVGGDIFYGGPAWGGAAIHNNAGTLNVTNSTFAFNIADTSKFATGTIEHTAFTNSLTLKNTLLVNNTGGNCYNPYSLTTLNADGTNFVDDATCDAATQKTSAEINLGPLANNGGSTQTMALLPGSVAIDAGDDANCPTTDQRGMARQDGDNDAIPNCDIGAYEAGSMICGAWNTPPPFTFTFPDQSGVQLHFEEQAEYSANCMYVEEVPASHPSATGTAEGDNLKSGVYWRLAAYDGDRAYGVEPPVFTVTLTLPHDNLTNAQVCKYPGTQAGSGWDCFTPSSTTPSWVTLDGVTSFSEWAVGDDVGPTAVELNRLTAQGTATGWLLPMATLAVLALATLLGGGWLVWRKQS